MMNALTPEQCRLVRQTGDEPVIFEDPETHEYYVVIRNEVFQRLKDAGRCGRDEGRPSDDPTLIEDVRTYESHLPEWLDREGQYVLIKGGEVIGLYPRYEEAMATAYDRFGDGDFLVKKIARYETVYHLGNVAH